MKTIISAKLVFAAAAVVLVSGCAVKAPPYQGSINNIQVLQRAQVSSARLGEFTVKAGATGATEISLRGNPMTSPVGDSFAAYLADGLKQELDLAKRLDPKSSFEISGTMLGTDIDTAVGTASGYLEARFVVKQDGVIRFDKVKRGESSWESSFVGAVAIPKAMQSYPVIVQSVLSALYSDSDFQNSLK